MIENEGPKAPFVEKIQRFADQWEGPDFLHNIVFYEEPWGRFSSPTAACATTSSPSPATSRSTSSSPARSAASA
jgi:hypothetical protein